MCILLYTHLERLELISWTILSILNGGCKNLRIRRAKVGGLNEFGIPVCKSKDDFAAKEVEWFHSTGGIDI